MKRKLSLNEMTSISAGRSKFWDGFCAGVALVDASWAFGLIAMTPVGGLVVIGSTAGCAIREIALQNG